MTDHAETGAALAPTSIRVAQFNASLNRFSEGQIVTDLSTPDNAQAKTVAEIIQRVNPDVLLINEFDFFAANPMQAVDLFRDNYLEVAQNTLNLPEGASAIDFPYAYIAPSNTGIASGFDLNNNGAVVTTPGAPGYGDDALGFGNFPGQFGMLILSKHEIVEEGVRTFQEFLWQDMPGARLPDDPATAAPADWYSPAELEIFRLSSKSHWDVPILVDGEVVHILASHPTPPVFDGPEDRNGLRNADEIRLSADYATPGAGGYIYDDAGGTGGLGGRQRFVLLGDQNADPKDGDALRDAAGNPIAIQQILDNPTFDTSTPPSSDGGPQQAVLQGQNNAGQTGNPAFDTADFADFGTNPGNLRADYALPSAYGLDPLGAGVFWPLNTDPLFPLVGTFPFPSSDHRMIWVDVAIVEEPELALGFPGAGTGPLTYRAEATGLLQRSDAADDVTGASDDVFAAAYGDIAFLGTGVGFTPEATSLPFARLDWEGSDATLTGLDNTTEAVEVDASAIESLSVSGFDEAVAIKSIRRSKTTEATFTVEDAQTLQITVEGVGDTLHWDCYTVPRDIAELEFFELEVSVAGDPARPTDLRTSVSVDASGVDATFTVEDVQTLQSALALPCDQGDIFIQWSVAGDPARPADLRTSVSVDASGVDATIQVLWQTNSRNGSVDTVTVEGSDGDDSITLDYAIAGTVRGRQVLVGGAGEDTITGDEGRQRINGGEGADLLTGGADADRFVIRAGDADGDVITDLAAEDRLMFRGYGAGDPTISIDGDTWTITGSNGVVDTLTILIA